MEGGRAQEVVEHRDLTIKCLFVCRYARKASRKCWQSTEPRSTRQLPGREVRRPDSVC